MEKILVTGAGGFVGARILEQLGDRYEMAAFPRGMLASAGRAEVLAAVRAAAPEVILHTAAVSDTGYSEAHPDQSYRANVELTLWMAEAAREVGAKLVCFSSDQVYAGLPGKGPFAEEDVRTPANVYGRHKREAEQRGLDLSARRRLSAGHLDVRPARLRACPSGETFPSTCCGRRCGGSKRSFPHRIPGRHLCAPGSGKHHPRHGPARRVL